MASAPTPSSPQSPSSENPGWKENILIPTIVAGVIGASAGLVSKHRNVHGVGSICGTYATNLAIVAGCYCGAHEFVREARVSGPDDLLNSVAGGIMSGAVLGRLQGGQLGAARYALIFAVAGTAIDFASMRLKSTIMQRYRNLSIPEWSWPKWSPIQVLDEEALAAKRAREQKSYEQRMFGKLKKEES